MAHIRELPDSELVRLYIAIRDRRAKRKAEFDASDASDKEKQGKIELEFLSRFDAQGIDSVSARGVGTAYTSTRVTANVADKDTFFNWVGEDFEERKMFLESRVSKTAVDQYMAANDDIPPGTNVRTERTVNVRRN